MICLCRKTEIDADADTEIDVESGIEVNADSDEGKENRDPLQETVTKIGRREFTYKERIRYRTNISMDTVTC